MSTMASIIHVHLMTPFFSELKQIADNSLNKEDYLTS